MIWPQSMRCWPGMTAASGKLAQAARRLDRIAAEHPLLGEALESA